MIVQKKRDIQSGTGINVGCANKGILSQTREGELQFNNVPQGTKDVKPFHDMYSSLISGGKFVKKGCSLVFEQKNAHIVKGRTGELVKEVMKQDKQENIEDIVMTVPFDMKKLTRKTVSTGQENPLFNITSNVNQIRSK